MDERKSNRRWALIATSLLVAIAVFWLVASERLETAPLRNAIGLKPSAKSNAAGTTKPICSQVIVPAGTDCIPQHLANLPPDPGPAGMKTIEGIDSDKDGLRDDVQRYIAMNYGHSALAVKVLTNIAMTKQIAVKYGDSLGREESQKLASKFMNAGRCYSRTATPEWHKSQAMEKVEIEVTNTPERFKRAHAFSYMLAHNVYMFGDETAAELCGFDPATFSN